MDSDLQVELIRCSRVVTAELLQCTLQLAEVHTFIGISWFVHNVWEIMRCVDRVRWGAHTKLVPTLCELCQVFC